MHSYHDNRKEDRIWSLGCTGAIPWTSYSTFGPNGWDQVFWWDGISDNSFMVGMSSKHDNRKEDRQFKLYYTNTHNGNLRGCSGWKKLNSYDGVLNLVLTGDEVIAALYSTHDNRKEDREWQAKTCTLTSNSGCHDNASYLSSCPHWTNYCTGVYESFLKRVCAKSCGFC